MTALVRYGSADFVRSQLWFAPLVAALAVAAIDWAVSGPAPEGYALTIVAIYGIAAWLGAVYSGAEDPVQREVTVVTCGSRRRVAAARLVGALVWACTLSLLVFAYPIAIRAFSRRPSIADLGMAAVAHLVCAAQGAAVGTLFGPLVIRRRGYSVATIAFVVLFALAPLSVPPVLPVAVAVVRGREAALALAGIGGLVFTGALSAMFLKLAPDRD